MLGVGQRVDRWQAAESRKRFDITLREGADDRAVQHSAQHPGGVLNGFAAPELEVVRV